MPKKLAIPKKTVYRPQIMSDNHGYVDYIPHGHRAEYDSERACNAAVAKLQTATKGNHFQYRVSKQVV